ncbi:hypothetical protein LX36DRAFT_659362, partial [Colletotrichum falcatum]
MTERGSEQKHAQEYIPPPKEKKTKQKRAKNEKARDREREREKRRGDASLDWVGSPSAPADWVACTPYI